MPGSINFPDFFRGETQTPEGLIIEDVWFFDDVDMSNAFKFMPYLFPGKKKLLFHPSYPILTPEERTIIVSDQECLSNIGKTAMKLVEYWERKTSLVERDLYWMTKCYEFLRDVNLEPEAIKVLVLMKHLVELGQVSGRTYRLWLSY